MFQVNCQRLSIKILIVIMGLQIAAMRTANAEAPLVYINPPTPEYFRLPFGEGTLQICQTKNSGEWASKNHLMKIPMGTYFADQGTVNQIPSSTPTWWLLSVVTTENSQLQFSQKCTKVHARIALTEAPPAHKEMQSIARFNVSDHRLLGVSTDPNLDIPNPNLSPWNSEFPEIEATAVTDFK